MTLQEAFASHVEESPGALPETDLALDPPLPQARICEEELMGSSNKTCSQLQTFSTDNQCLESASHRSNDGPPPGKKPKVNIESDKSSSSAAMGYSRCDKCGEDLPSEYFSEHVDYHLAQELHQVLNSPPVVSPTCKPALPGSNSPHKRRKKSKSSSSRAVTHKITGTSSTKCGTTGPSGAKMKQIDSFFNRLPCQKDSL